MRARDRELRKMQGRPPLPEDEPEPAQLHEDLAPVIEAWQELLADRGAMGTPLAYTAMSRWCEDRGIRGDERVRLCRLIRAVDVAHLNATHKQKGRR